MSSEATATDQIVLHANWSGGELCVWAESLARVPGELHEPEEADAPAESPGDAIDEPEPDPETEQAPEPTPAPTDEDETPIVHPFVLSASELRAHLGALLRVVLGAEPGETSDREIRLRIPAAEDVPLPSARLSHIGGLVDAATASMRPTLRTVRIEAVAIDPAHAPALLETLDERRERGEAMTEQSVEFFVLAWRFARRLLAQQRFVPGLLQDGTGDLQGVWQPWLADEQTAEEAAQLAGSMPPSVRATVDGAQHASRAVLGDFLLRVTDAACRRSLVAESLLEVIEGRDTRADASSSWLAGLLDSAAGVPLALSGRQEMVRDIRRWIGQLEDRGMSSLWRLCLRVNEPIELPDVDTEDGKPIIQMSSVPWSLSFHIQPIDGSEDLLVDAADIWLMTAESVSIEGKRLDTPQELLLGELGRASRIYKPLEKALGEIDPIELPLDTQEAYRFLREVRPVLIEQGFGVQAPVWWESPTSRLGAKLLLDSEPLPEQGGEAATAAAAQLGLDALVGYQWQIAVGDTTLTLKQFEDLAGQKVPLVRINGRWVEIRPEDVEAAIKFIRENPGGQMKVGEAIRLAFGTDTKQSGIRVTGIEASGWLAQVFSGETKAEVVPEVPQPETFHGKLRPYQERGLAWLHFLEKFGFGACLADDMGLGKTIQLLALMAHEREQAPPGPDGTPTPVKPTLLVVPTSVVGNWVHESDRFTPHLRCMIHHGPDRAQGEAFVEKVASRDLIITTYALANRDKELLGSIAWGRLVLDEAQYIKNPQSKQSQAVRELMAERRIALTGTPVENRLSELWSLMDFLNPGYLGPAGNFRKRFGVPIERYNDQHKSAQLRGLVQPFVLRRLKTDPRVVSDLPPKVESREYAHLTTEQAEMYEACVKRTLSDVEQAEGIKRRGVVLAALVKLKQICNHPAQALKESESGVAGVPDPARSGKAQRICEMLDEIVAAGDQALVFTQFRQMGHLLAQMFRKQLDREVLFLHGGTPRLQRQRLVENFQRADGTNPVMLISLKAGGVGLNLTAANHVFHYDRWWNPAVENQATDRAYRIGQTRTVQVHKFVCRGTLEERIDQMLEQKLELAEQIVGAGEQWLTELDTNQLKELLSLRNEAVGE